MPIRNVGLNCKEPGCNTCVVVGKVVDSIRVWELEFHPSVTDAPALNNGMGIGDFYDAVVKHGVNGDRVEHTIASR